MSFILEALKKSEEERRRGEVPDLRAGQTVSPPPASRRKHWPLVLTAALLVNALLLAWWLRPWQPQPLPPAPAVVASAPPMTIAATEPRPAEAPPAAASPSPPAAAVVPLHPGVRSASEPAGWSDFRPAPSPSIDSTAPVRKAGAALPARPGRGIPHWRDIPTAAAKGLPELNISLHYYDADAGARLIRLNGRILREGDLIAEGLKLEEITSTGVIVNWRGEKYRAGEF